MIKTFNPDSIIIKRIFLILKRRNSMKHAIHLILSLSAIILISITCTEEPAGPDISDDLKPKGTITGWVYDMWNRPIKDVLVSVNADSADAGVSTATGQFIVGNVREGTYVLRFTHRDYEDNPICTVTVSLGVDDTVITPVPLSYRYYILQGNVTVNGAPQAGAGVAIADYTEGALTGPGGSFILRQVPKNDTLTLVCAYGAVSTQVTKITGCLANDTNNLGTIDLTLTGATISGTVYDPGGAPKPNTTVTAVGGGLKTTTDQDGFYLLRNVPANENGIIVMVNEDGYIGASIGFVANENAYISGCDIHLYPEPEIINGMKLIGCDVYVPSTSLAVVLRVYPTTDVNTEIAQYSWNIGGVICTTSVPSCPVSIAQLTTAATLVQVQAANAEGNLSGLMSFYIYLIGTAPVVDSISVSADKITYLPAITIQEDAFAWFHVRVTDLFGGLASMTWNFGDDSSWTAPDSNPSIGHLYDTAGVYAAVFQALDTDGNLAADTVSVTVVKPVLTKPVLLSPDSGAVIKVPKDSVTLSWQPVTGTGIVYNVYMDWQNTIPSEQNIVGTALTAAACTVPVDSARTYYWRVKAVRTADNAYVWSRVHSFTVYTNSSDIAPLFLSNPEDMTDTMLLSKVYIDTLKAMDENGDQLTFSFIDSVDSMKLIGNVLSFKPTRDNNGLRHVSVQVADGTGLFDTLPWDIYINVPIELQAPVYVSPSDKDTNATLIDSVILIWLSSGDNIIYNVLWDVKEIPTAYAVKDLNSTAFKIAVDSGKTFYWQIEAFRPLDSAFAKGAIRKYTGRCYDLINGLVAYYPFNGNADDESGNGNHGTVNGATLTEDRFLNPNSAYSFSGVNDFINCGNDDTFNLRNALTIAAWMKPAKDRWKFKRLIMITPSTPEENYQIQLELDIVNFNYTNANSGGSDLRFYDKNCQKLAFWIEEWNSNGISIVWVNIKTAGTELIYMYHGNPTANSESNGVNTFPSFNDFSSDPSIEGDVFPDPSNFQYDAQLKRVNYKNQRTGSGGIQNWYRNYAINTLITDNGYLRIKDFKLEEVNVPTEYGGRGHFYICSNSDTLSSALGFAVSYDPDEGNTDNTISSILGFAYDSSGTGIYTNEFDATLKEGNTYDIKVYLTGQYLYLHIDGVVKCSVNIGSMNLGTGHFYQYNYIVNRLRTHVGSQQNSIEGWYDNQIIKKYYSNAPVISVGKETVAGINKAGSYGINGNTTTAYASINDNIVTGSITPGWNYVVLTYDRNLSVENQRLHINGPPVATSIFNEIIEKNKSSFFIGDIMAFVGIIDDVRIYNRALSDTDVQRLYNLEKP